MSERTYWIQTKDDGTHRLMLNGMINNLARPVSCGKPTAAERQFWMELQELRDAIARSPFDLAPCRLCGKDTICIPDGLPMCDLCGTQEEQEQRQ